MTLEKTTLALAAIGSLILTACNRGDAATETPAPIEYQSPSDVKFLYDDEGNIPHSIPVELLKDMQAQFIAQGENTLLMDFKSRYDMKTGMVLNPEEAIRAEKFLKENLHRIETEEFEPETAAGGKSLKSLPEGMEMPPEVAEHQKRIQQQGGY